MADEINLDDPFREPNPADERIAELLYSYLRAGYPTAAFPGMLGPNGADFWRRAVAFVRASIQEELGRDG